ncbi:hypothetical protein N9P79_00605 [Crocinitomicaceae bacterium]|nr:hypothetical protein [Crocinitomicaceae bacterium]
MKSSFFGLSEKRALLFIVYWKNGNEHIKGVIVYPKGNSRRGSTYIMHSKGECQTGKDRRDNEDQ